MTAEEFYTEFKESLKYLGPGFHGMGEVSVSIEGNKFRMSCDGRETLLVLPVSRAERTPQPADGKADQP